MAHRVARSCGHDRSASGADVLSRAARDPIRKENVIELILPIPA